MQLLCKKVLAHPEKLPPAMACHGIAMELGADLTQHWWASAGTASDLDLSCVEVGAWPSEMHPEMAAVIPFEGATARQAVEFALGPTKRFPDLAGPLCGERPGW